MELLNTVGDAIKYAIQWIGETVEATIDWGLAGPSEGAIITIALLILGRMIYKAVRHR